MSSHVDFLSLQMNYFWNNLNQTQKVVTGIIGINVAVFLAWKVPSFRPVMMKYFVSSPFGSKYIISLVT